MKHFLFHLMPYQHPPADFEKHHDSAWVWIPNELFDPKRIPGAELRVIAACGHMSVFEKPEAWAEAVRAFLG